MKNKRPLAPGLWELIFTASLSAVLIILHAFLCEYTELHPVPTAVLFAAILAVSSVAFFFIKRNMHNKKNRSPLPETVQVLASTMVELPHPALICTGDSDTVIWTNKAAVALFGTRSARFCDLFSTLEDEDESIRLGALGRRFAPISYTAKGTDQKTYKVFIMQDTTEYDAENARLEGKESAVAYITVDNLDELLNYEQEDYRTASGTTEKILRDWATAAGGVLKEYQQDKYIFLFERSNIERFTQSGFDILDRIRNIRIGENSIPLTVSMGIAAIDGTPLERDKAAQAALETALQRGGDQVVLKTDSSVEIFGGKTKIPQKRTKVKARVVANELISHISSSSNVLIMGHKFADFDAFGASVGLARLSMFCGVPVNIVSDLNDSNLDKCRQLLESEKDYNGVFIDADSAMDLLSSDTLLIIADVNNRMQFESSALADHCRRIAIVDHHRKTAEFENPPLITYIEPAASAASELVCEMLEQVLPQGVLLSVEANLMMAGILLDTNQFTKNTGTRTFSAALYLRGIGADVGEVQELFKTDLWEFKRELKFHTNVEIYEKETAIAVSNEPCTYKDKIPAAKAADKLLTVEGVKASFVLVPIGNEIHISARSTGTINVQLLLEKMNGGGHFDSAGTRLTDRTVEDVIEELKKHISNYLKENNQNSQNEKGETK